MKIKGGDKGWSHQPVWADADKYLEELAAEQEFEALEKEQQQRQRLAPAQQAAAAAAADGAPPDAMQQLEAAAG